MVILFTDSVCYDDLQRNGWLVGIKLWVTTGIKQFDFDLRRLENITFFLLVD